MTDSAPPGKEHRETASPRRSWKRGALRALAVLAAACLALGGAAALGLLLVQDHLHRPAPAGPEAGLVIPEGATGQDVARILAEEGLVSHELLFRLALRLDEDSTPIRHGYYILPRGLTPVALAERLREGPAANRDPRALPPELRVTIREGLSLEQMAQLFDDPDAFLEAASDPALIEELDLDAPNLEGFLMPNTYFFDEKPDERAVVERMLDQFQREYARLMERYPHGRERDPLEVVTIASLIEREARAAAERPLVSAVIHNRLERGMTLDLDATLQFALNKYGQRMLNEDKEVDSPYNSYRNAGLPPGPIASPGVDSLRAALNPADVDYLYFVSNADGYTHTFSETLAEHNRAVARYRAEIAVQRRALQE